MLANTRVMMALSILTFWTVKPVILLQVETPELLPEKKSASWVALKQKLLKLSVKGDKLFAECKATEVKSVGTASNTTKMKITIHSNP